MFVRLLSPRRRTPAREHSAETPASRPATHFVRMVASTVPLTWDEISQHNTKNDCWVVVDGVVYDMTDFLDDHPGGKRLPVKHSGKDVTEIWNSFHGEAACSAAKPSWQQQS